MSALLLDPVLAVQPAVGRMSAQGKREVRVPVAHMPPAVKVIRPQLQGGSDVVPNYMADYLAENISWTIAYVTIIKVRPDISPRLRDWAEFLPAEASEEVDPHLLGRRPWCLPLPVRPASIRLVVAEFQCSTRGRDDQLLCPQT